MESKLITFSVNKGCALGREGAIHSPCALGLGEGWLHEHCSGKHHRGARGTALTGAQRLLELPSWGLVGAFCLLLHFYVSPVAGRLPARG